jgi:hypothetical protein
LCQDLRFIVKWLAGWQLPVESSSFSIKIISQDRSKQNNVRFNIWSLHLVYVDAIIRWNAILPQIKNRERYLVMVQWRKRPENSWNKYFDFNRMIMTALMKNVLIPSFSLCSGSGRDITQFHVMNDHWSWIDVEQRFWISVKAVPKWNISDLWKELRNMAIRLSTEELRQSCFLGTNSRWSIHEKWQCYSIVSWRHVFHNSRRGEPLPSDILIELCGWLAVTHCLGKFARF